MDLKAVINGDKIECGKCGSLIGTYFGEHEEDGIEYDFIIRHSPYVTKSRKNDNSRVILKKVCTHEENREKCGNINTVEWSSEINGIASI